MKSIDLFVANVSREVPGCIDDVVSDAIISAAIEFCRDTEVWVYEHDPIMIVKSLNNDYEFDLPEHSQIYRFNTMQNSNGDPVYEKSRPWLNENKPEWQTETAAAIEYILMLNDKTFMVTPVPTKTDINGLKAVSIILYPSRTAKKLPDDLYNTYFDAICDGARARLMAMPNKPWTDLKSAGVYEARYLNAKSNAGNPRVVKGSATILPATGYN